MHTIRNDDISLPKNTEKNHSLLENSSISKSFLSTFYWTLDIPIVVGHGYKENMSDECSSDVASCLVYGTIMGPIF